MSEIVFSMEETCPNCSSTTDPKVDATKMVLLGIGLLVFVVFGILGNILVILSVVCHHHWRSVTHYFIANLAAADLLLSSAVLPFSATSEALGKWVFGRSFCSVWAALDVLCCTASILSLCVISIDRYLAVSYPLRYPVMATGQRGMAAVAALWGLSAAISVGPLFGWKEPDPEDETVCRITEEPGYALFSALASFYIPLAIILSMYCRVYSVAKRGTETLRKSSDGVGVETEGVILRVHRGNAAQTGKHEEDNIPGRSKHITSSLPKMLKLPREEKAAKTLGVVVGCFILCWLPFFLVLPIGSVFPSCKPPETLFKITFWLGYFNSCINPIIYPCFSKEFKKAFHNVLHGRCLRCAKAQGPHTTTHSTNPGPVSNTPDSSSHNGASLSGCCGALCMSSEGGADDISSAIQRKRLLRSWCFSARQTPVPENSSAKVLHLSLNVTGEAV
ncbi:alpha-1A adrenergic receptor-like [Phycodurus eques]|uniref:alpha-1A adrenergic receptor-like n=1 Tax=Phycodurus eques TaxID=693459 RepID=UPI002ACDEBBF|nr:alpha-1A adrenergic receptor-like [Phycodurus eques]